MMPFEIWPDWLDLDLRERTERLAGAGTFRLVGHVVRWEVFETLGQEETIRQVEKLARESF